MGGQRSGKSRCAERRAAAWLAQPGHDAVLVATALAGDSEMHDRIARHRQDRCDRVPALVAHEVPYELAAAAKRLTAPGRLLVIDCLTMWLANLLTPMHGHPVDAVQWLLMREALCGALAHARGPVLLVSNEIGLGVTPASAATRRFVDELGRLNQEVAALCAHVTLMVAGIEWPLKRAISTP